MELKHHAGVLTRRDSFIIDPRLLNCEPGYNVRDLTSPENREHIDGLKESIGVNGVRVPLEIRLAGEDIYIVAGHCRHIAVMELIAEGRDDIKGVPCIPESKTTNDAERTLNLAISNSGKPLTTLEIAEVVRRLGAFGWTEEEIQKRMRWKSRASVTHHAEVARLPEAVKTQIKQGEVSATTALRISKNCDPAEAERLLKANREENKRLGVGAKNNFKVTAKTLNRNKPKPNSPKSDSRPQENTGGSEPASQSPPDAVPAQLHGESQDERVQAPTAPLADTNSKPLPDVPGDGVHALGLTDGSVVAGANVVRPLRPNTKELIEALEPFANIAQEENFDERGDHDLIEVPFKHLKKAWQVFAKVVGETA